MFFIVDPFTVDKWSECRRRQLINSDYLNNCVVKRNRIFTLKKESVTLKKQTL
jgi:hypothetical protein